MEGGPTIYRDDNDESARNLWSVSQEIPGWPNLWSATLGAGIDTAFPPVSGLCGRAVLSHRFTIAGTLKFPGQ